jgi:hypothetical protein
MADPRKPLDQDEVKRQQEAAASAKLREIMLKRARETPAAPRLSNDGAEWTYVAPQNLMEQEDSNASVFVEGPDGGAKKLGIDMYVAGAEKPLDPNKLRQDWGDARNSQASNPEQMRDYTLDGTVRFENGQWIARGASGEDEPVAPDMVQGYLNDIGEQPGFELHGDAAKKAYERLGQQPAPAPGAEPARPDLRSMLMPKAGNSRHQALRAALDTGYAPGVDEEEDD